MPATSPENTATNIARLAAEQAKLRREAIALIDCTSRRPRTCTFAALDADAAEAAGRLREAGLKAGDTVLVFLPVSLDLYAHMIAMFRLGLAAMFVNPLAGHRAVARACALHPPRGFVATRALSRLAWLSPTIRRIPIRLAVPERGHRDGRHAPGIVAVPADTPALITFTSGSTGVAKPVARSHGFLVEQHRAITRAVPLTAGDIDLTTLPIVVLANIASGVTTLLPPGASRAPRRRDAAHYAALAARHGATTMTSRPAVLRHLADHCFENAVTLPGLQRIVVGGDPVGGDLLLDLRRIAPDARIVAVYGATEAEPIARVALDEISDADMAAMRAGNGQLVGAPVPGIEAVVLPDRWGQPVGPLTRAALEQSSLQPGEAGEVVVSGPHVQTGYVDAEADRTTKIRVGETVWHRTGDRGWFDQDGRLWLDGRCGR